MSRRKVAKGRPPFDLATASLQEIAEFVTSNKGDALIAKFIEDMVAKVGSKEGYTKMVKAAEKDLVNGKLPSAFFKLMMKIFKRFIIKTPTGHGVSHLYQDILAAIVFATDKVFKQWIGWKFISAADLWAGLVSGILHDIGNSVVARYKDWERRNGHAEIGAWLVFYLLEGHLSEEMRYLIAYNIAAHTHYTQTEDKELVWGGTYKRPIYWYEDIDVFKEGLFVGIGVIITRAIDRLGTRGYVLMARHLLAAADSVQSGVVGIDLSGKGQAYQVDREALRVHILTTAEMVDIGRPKPVPTVWQHILNLSAGDLNRNEWPYGKNDLVLGETLQDLLRIKEEQAKQLARVLEDTELTEEFDRVKALLKIKTVLNMFSRAQSFNGAWEELAPLFNELSDLELAKWQAAVEAAEKGHASWMSFMLMRAKSDSTNPILAIFDDVLANAL